MLDFYQYLPSHLSPIAFTIGPFAIRWYGLSYLIGFFVVYKLLLWRIKKGELIFLESKIQSPKPAEMKNLLLDYLLVIFFVGILGGRLGYVLFYDFLYFLSHPLAIFSPFDQNSGEFVGIFGMSYFGALVGATLATFFYAKIKKINFLAWADFVVVALPAGYFFGRIGNFLNGELYGRVTELNIGMYFLADENFLRHPSQLYEAFFEGIVFFLLLWSIRNKKLKNGALLGLYLLGYSLVRFCIEQLREPDLQLGLFWNYFTMGQLLSCVSFAVGIFLFVSKKIK
ncbi:MAG: prolipoprotein diacylglyceryl transferase [bacterium]